MAINKYGIPIILVVGLIGNLLTLILMRRPVMKSTTSAIYFSTRSVVYLQYVVTTDLVISRI